MGASIRLRHQLDCGRCGGAVKVRAEPGESGKVGFMFADLSVGVMWYRRFANV